MARNFIDERVAHVGFWTLCVLTGLLGAGGLGIELLGPPVIFAMPFEIGVLEVLSSACAFGLVLVMMADPWRSRRRLLWGFTALAVWYGYIGLLRY